MFLLYNLLILFYLVTLFFQNQTVEYITGILAIAAIVMSFKFSGGLYKVTSIVFLLSGLGIFIYLGMPLVSIPYYMSSTLMILALFYVLPFVNAIVVTGRYDQSASMLLKAKLTNLGQLYSRVLIVSFILGIFLNVATVTVTENVLRKNMKHSLSKIRDVFTSQAVLRGYALSLTWSPMEIIVAVTIDVTGVDYLEFLPWLLLFSVTLLAIEYMIPFRYRKVHLEKSEENKENIDKRNILKILSLFLFLVLFIVIISFISNAFELSFLTAVTLVIPPFTLLWALLIRRLNKFLSYGIRKWQQRVKGMNNFFLLFLSLGFFISILQKSGYITIFNQPLMSLQNQPIILFILIQVLFLGLAMVGFHPLVTISMVGEVVQPLLLAINPLSIGIVLITSALSTVMAGPFNITVSLMSDILKRNPYRISLFNIGFAFLFSTFGTILAVVLL
jgi:hypothetical protein